MTDLVHCPAVLALELASPPPGDARALPTEAAAALVDAVATDLVRLLPGVDALGLALSGALYDPAQLLRPGWPLFEALVELGARQARGRSGQLIGFGTAGGRFAASVLEPEPALGLGALACVPITLSGPSAPAQRIGEAMEARFSETGQAGAATVLLWQQALGVSVVHARYLTRHDLCAVIAAQYESQGLGAVWQLIEGALLSPKRIERAALASGQVLVVDAGKVSLEDSSPEGWLQRHGHALDPATRADAYAHWHWRQREALAVLTAHGIVRVDGGPGGLTIHAEGSASRWLRHRARGLGTVLLSALDGSGRVLAQGWPWTAAELPALRQQLRERCGDAPEEDTPLAFDGEGRVRAG